MLVFPQLSSGAAAQMPLERETGYRTLVNRMADGNEIRVTDQDYLSRRWKLRLRALSDEEWQAIGDLFAAAEGRLKTFLFLEPGENLLAWSERFVEDVWEKTGVTVAEDIDDPFGGTDASGLSGAGTVRQSMEIPAGFRYAGSVWARTTAAGASLELSDGAGTANSVAFDTGGQWRRYTLSTVWTSEEETVLFTVHSPGAVDVFGAQIEAQPFASDYKKTLAAGGVHPGARFDTDALDDRLTAPHQHSTVIPIAWTPSQT